MLDQRSVCIAANVIRFTAFRLCLRYSSPLTWRLEIMGLENTITEQDLDAAAERFVQRCRQDSKEIELDLAVDGLSESIVSRFMRLITFGRW